MSERTFGHIAGYPPGSMFASRSDLSLSGVHRPLQAGISGSAVEGADSIVLSGGYEDDQDLGDEIIYTGHGGRDPETGQQVGDQLLTRGNLALAYNRLYGLPVRVIRGARQPSIYAPTAGYRYDGLFSVDDYWHDRGVSGHAIWRFRLARVPEQTSVVGLRETPAHYAAAPRQAATILRIVRDTAQARRIKELYEHQCQICGVRLAGTAGPYAEAAHIRPLGAPHAGPDTADNILCLCPNHHVLLDYGGIAIADDFGLLGAAGQLLVRPQHHIAIAHIRYHRAHYYRGFG